MTKRRSRAEIAQAELTEEQRELNLIVLDILCSACALIKPEILFPLKPSSPLGRECICNNCTERRKPKLSAKALYEQQEQNRADLAEAEVTETNQEDV